MGAGGILALDKILEKTEERLKIIVNYYKKIGKIKKADKYFIQHSIIILLTLREIKILKEILKENDKKEIKISQCNINIKKIYLLKFKNIDFESKTISGFKTALENIQKDLSGFIDAGDINDGFQISVLDNLDCPFETDGYLLKIIIKANNDEFNDFFKNYADENLKIVNDINYNYKKEDLENLKMAKYFYQLLIFMKLYVKFNVEKKVAITQEEKNECIKNVNEEKIILTHFLLFEMDVKFSNIPNNLIEHNEEKLDELLKTYKNLLDKIAQQENKLFGNSNINK
jgi:hypothetical protein